MVVDGLFAILWFAASIAVTTWVNAGIREGEKKDQEKKLKGCAAFAYGPESKCKLSKVTIAMGVIILYIFDPVGIPSRMIKAGLIVWSSFLFLATCGISIRNLIHFRKHGSLPGSGPRAPDPIEDQTKYAFSSNPHDEFDEDLEDRATRPPRREDDEYALLHTTTEDGTHPGRPLSWGREHAPSPLNDFDSADTSYHGGRNHSQSGRHQPHGDTYKESLPPAGTNLNDSSGSSNGRYHGSGAQQLSRPPRYEVSDPFGDDQALRRDDGRSASGERVEFPPANYHR